MLKSWGTQSGSLLLVMALHGGIDDEVLADKLPCSTGQCDTLHSSAGEDVVIFDSPDGDR